TRNNRKRCMGRATKNLADLTLQAGLVTESLTLYHTSCETLRAIGDSLWLGAAYEGLCSASSILLYPNVRYATSLQRNASLQANSPEKMTNRPANQENFAKAALSKKAGLVIQLESDTVMKSSSSSSTSSSTSSVSSILSSSSSSTSEKKDTPT